MAIFKAKVCMTRCVVSVLDAQGLGNSKRLQDCLWFLTYK